jgi:HK97 family phage prohead protease
MSSTPPTAASGPKPVREHRVLPLEDVEWRKSGSGPGQLTIRGHASVFDRLSLDLGGFREKIAPGAFTSALDRNPDVHALWNHDTKYVLARTKNKTLELREDPIGLHFWAKVADTSYARDLQVLMERGDVDQASFAFTVSKDEWATDENDNVTRTILEVDNLYDVTVCAAGAYPQTDTSVVAHMRSRLNAEISEGRLPKEAANKIVAPDDPVDVSTSQEWLDEDKQRNLAPKVEDDSSRKDEPERVRPNDRAKLLNEMAEAVAIEKERKGEIGRRKYQITRKESDECGDSTRRGSPAT